MESYESLMRQAANFRDMARNLDGYQQRAVMRAALECESQARQLKRNTDKPGSKPE